MDDLDYGPAFGVARPQMVCPLCGERGGVETERVKAKRGISGAKATGAVVTGGLSLFATGLSRKEWITKGHCRNCHGDWAF